MSLWSQTPSSSTSEACQGGLCLETPSKSWVQGLAQSNGSYASSQAAARGGGGFIKAQEANSLLVVALGVVWGGVG